LELLEHLLWGWFLRRLLLGRHRLILRSVFFDVWLFGSSSIGVAGTRMAASGDAGMDGRIGQPPQEVPVKGNRDGGSRIPTALGSAQL